MLHTYNKLIRDKNIDIIASKGHRAVYRILDDKDYDIELDKKLVEEVNEYIADHSIEEMADILEVINAILEYRGINMEDVEKSRIEKRNSKGDFSKKIFLEHVEEI